MKTWWVGAAAAAIWLGVTATARAQAPPPGGGPIQEPAPVGACAPALPPAVPGPLTGAGAPGGPGLDLSLPATIPTAWGPGPKPESGFFASVGGVSYQRQRPGNTPFVLRDTNNNLDNGNIPALINTTKVQNFHDISPGINWGVAASFGYMLDDAALEVAGFYVGDKDSRVESRDPGRLTLFFHNPPVGFEGDNGLWRQADRTITTLRTALASGELNYRWWSRSTYGLEGILGVRYLDVQEKISIFTDDDGILVRDINLFPDPNRQATYSVRSHNRILGPQLGFEAYTPVCKWLFFGLTAKGVWGANFLEVDYRLTRGDLFVGRSERRDTTTFSHAYELNAFFDIIALERVKLRAGYNLLWVANVNEAIRQIDYDLLQPGPKKDDGSILYHGPMVELHLIF